MFPIVGNNDEPSVSTKFCKNKIVDIPIKQDYGSLRFVTGCVLTSLRSSRRSLIQPSKIYLLFI